MSREKEIKLFERLYRYGEEGLTIDANIAREIEEMIEHLKSESEPEPGEFTKRMRSEYKYSSTRSAHYLFEACDLIDRLKAELKGKEEKIAKLVKFCREFISVECWGYQPEIDGGDVQELAEKCGLIESHIATEEDVDEADSFEVGEKIYRFTDILIMPSY